MTVTSDLGPIELLLVEDNEADVYLLESFFSQSSTPNRLHTVCDGEAAMDFLRQANEYADAPRPDLIILDLNLPRKDGREVLEELKADPALKAIPVIVMTGSAANQDILRSYELHASCYMTKPADWFEYNQTIQKLEDFWIGCVKFPATASS